ncbi:hypothetical protein K2173_004791 [Erythroxylum novogranatense]|uniref:Uncharacterized protein n=1 Tax=Erythroxylum novogranatense TaxID=1862640 RepID=A0AAV8SJW9_9ROSI|nr:hypothetical protein K2173_004791 [Erythroxylum novogranatense]
MVYFGFGFGFNDVISSSLLWLIVLGLCVCPYSWIALLDLCQWFDLSALDRYTLAMYMGLSMPFMTGCFDILQSLCNACGIRYRKRRIIGVGLDKDSDRQKQRTNITFTATATSASTSADSVCSSDSSSTSASGNNPMREPLNMSFVVWGKEVMIQRSSAIKKQRCQRRRKLREEEEAAFSLMALSCDSIFA